MREHLIPHGFISQVHYPPQVFPETLLKELYLQVSSEQPYNAFELLPGGKGGVMKHGEARAVEILTDRTVIRDQPTQVTYEEHLDQAIPILERIKDRSGQPVWGIQHSTISCLLPLEEPAAEALRRELFKTSQEALKQLGRPLLGLCLRLEIPPLKDNPTHISVRIEPYFKEAQMAFIEVGTRYLQPLQESSALRERFLSGYSFLRENVIGFLETTIGPPPPDSKEQN